MIEWGELIKEVLPKNYIQISFEKDVNNDNIRILNIIQIDNENNEIDIASLIK